VPVGDINYLAERASALYKGEQLLITVSCICVTTGKQ
jgi:hypothetical protein